MDLGKTIYELRKKNNMTQEELANRLNVSPQAVSKWENNLSCPDITLLADIAKIFEISVDGLLSGEYCYEDVKAEAPKIKAKPCSISRINISVDNNGKITNVSLPIKIVKFGLNIGTSVGGLSGEYSKLIMEAIENDLAGEILCVNGENGEIIKISLE